MRVIRSKEEYEVLCEEVWYHNRLYFQEAAPKISDEEFDSLIFLLEQVEKEHPEWISPTSPTQRIGEKPLEGFAEIVHERPMLSLEKAFKAEELESFYRRVSRLVHCKDVDFFADLKMDGVAISVTYEHGELVRAVTRGSGLVGSEITQNVKTIRELPLRIEKRCEFLEVRGEVFLPKEAFERMNAERQQVGLPLWANPRNAAAGSLKLLDSKEVAKRRGLSCVFYDIAQQAPHMISRQQDVSGFLHALGLPTWLSLPDLPFVPCRLVGSIEEMLQFQHEILAVREDLPFMIDGVVFKLDSLEQAAAIDPTLKHPRTSIAWKFGAEQVWTVIQDIVVQVGRTGVVTPVAELEPVLLSGSVIRRATLHNADEVDRKDVRIGDRVLIEKGGDVIPKVVMVDRMKEDRSGVWHKPLYCPSCQTKLERDDQEVVWRCPNNTGCEEQLIRRFIHFAGSSGLDIEHVGEKLIRLLFARGYVRTLSDLFLLRKDQLCSLEGIREKSAENILCGIERSKHPPLDRFLLALGIRFVGAGTAKMLSKYAGSLEKFLTLSYDEMIALHGIGVEVARSVESVLKDRSFLQEIESLLSVGVSPSVMSEQRSDHPFSGSSFVLTGTLHSMSRDAAKQKIERCGGVVLESVSKKTDFLVVGERPGSKLKKAESLGISILSEEMFVEQLKQ